MQCLNPEMGAGIISLRMNPHNKLIQLTFQYLKYMADLARNVFVDVGHLYVDAWACAKPCHHVSLLFSICGSSL